MLCNRIESACITLDRLNPIRWAQLIQKVYVEDPLLCPDCGAGMRIISFITDPPVVDKILRPENEWLRTGIASTDRSLTYDLHQF